jgi:hypothetical protein
MKKIVLMALSLPSFAAFNISAGYGVLIPSSSKSNFLVNHNVVTVGAQNTAANSPSTAEMKQKNANFFDVAVSHNSGLGVMYSFSSPKAKFSPVVANTKDGMNDFTWKYNAIYGTYTHNLNPFSISLAAGSAKQTFAGKYSNVLSKRAMSFRASADMNYKLENFINVGLKVGYIHFKKINEKVTYNANTTNAGDAQLIDATVALKPSGLFASINLSKEF